MSYRRDQRSSRAALFDSMDSLEEGGIRSSSSYSSGIDDHDNEKTMDSLHDRVSFLKRLTGDIHEEVDSHNRMLDRMGNEMDASRGIMSGTMDRFKMVFEKKSNRRICTLAAYFVVAFFVLYYTVRLVFLVNIFFVALVTVLLIYFNLLFEAGFRLVPIFCPLSMLP